MVDEQVKKIIDKTFNEVERLVKDVQKKRESRKINSSAAKCKRAGNHILKKHEFDTE